MKKSKYILLALLLSACISNAQTAMQFSELDCNGNAVDLYADLDAGKAVVLFFYMPNCGACPPPAQKIQTMANNINLEYPELVKGYAFPFNNTTDCAASISWASSSSVDHFFTPMDSGAFMVAYYGGFGMPTVVIVGGLDHRVLFVTQSFLTSDTTILRDSILALYSELNGIQKLPDEVSSFQVFPNPSSTSFRIQAEMKFATGCHAELTDAMGNRVAILLDEKKSSIISREVLTSTLPDGLYFVRLTVNGNVVTRKLTVKH